MTSGDDYYEFWPWRWPASAKSAPEWNQITPQPWFSLTRQFQLHDSSEAVSNCLTLTTFPIVYPTPPNFGTHAVWLSPSCLHTCIYCVFIAQQCLWFSQFSTFNPINWLVKILFFFFKSQLSSSNNSCESMYFFIL